MKKFKKLFITLMVLSIAAVVGLTFAMWTGGGGTVSNEGSTAEWSTLTMSSTADVAFDGFLFPYNQVKNAAGKTIVHGDNNEYLYFEKTINITNATDIGWVVSIGDLDLDTIGGLVSAASGPFWTCDGNDYHVYGTDENTVGSYLEAYYTYNTNSLDGALAETAPSGYDVAAVYGGYLIFKITKVGGDATILMDAGLTSTASDVAGTYKLNEEVDIFTGTGNLVFTITIYLVSTTPSVDAGVDFSFTLLCDIAP